MEKLDMHGATVERIENIKIENGQCFFDIDPQIYLKCNSLTSSIYIECEIEEADFQQEIMTIYYSDEDDGFSEDKALKKEIRSGEKITIDINFEHCVKAIRIDPIIMSGKCLVKKFTLSLGCQENIFEKEMSRKLYSDKDCERLVIVTHELSNSGAPILAYNIAKKMKERGKGIVVLSPQAGNGRLEKCYQEAEIPLFIIDDNISSFRISKENVVYKLTTREVLNKILRVLRKESYKTVITNTIVSGMYVKILKEYGFKIISLIHEMKTTIEIYQFKLYGQIIAKYADYIVFPNEFVKNDFYSIFKKSNGKSLIQAQGVYLNKNIEEMQDTLEKYGLIGKKYIMSSGTCELRKGVDLFIDAALILLAKRDDIHFVWTGNFHNKELECWMLDQIRRSGYEQHFHFISFVDDVREYKAILKNASAFWGMSREDPFPSTILEAMDNQIPVIGFCGTGGIHIMLSENRGILIEHFDLQQVVCQTQKLLGDDNERERIIDKAKKYIKTLDFNQYINFLDECTKKEKNVNAKLDLYKWGDWKHYYTNQLEEKSLQVKEYELNKICKKFRFVRDMKKIGDEIVLLDTAIGSDNIGDEIIMDYCMKACNTLFPNRKLTHIPTHIYDKKSESVGDIFKILCGTNLIYTRMEESKQWALPQNISSYRNICLLGVGMQQLGIDLQMSEYTKQFLKFILSSKFYHSVRDEETKRKLEEIGIKNVINTGCPTMWGLTQDKCKKISINKANNVLTTVTDYMQDRDADTYMLETLKEHYSKVYIWIQGLKDYEYLENLVDLDEFEIIPPSIEELDKILKTEELDYIGTRLHAGIRSLNMNHRSLIVAIDNRARAIHKDTNLPILERNDLKESLLEQIYQSRKTDIQLPLEKINQWKNQFK